MHKRNYLGFGFGMSAEETEAQARLLFGYIGFEPISDPRAVALLAAIPSSIDRITISQRAVELGANQLGIQKAYAEAYNKTPPTDAGASSTITIKPVPFYKNRKFWMVASTVLLVGGGVTGAVIWHRRAAVR